MEYARPDALVSTDWLATPLSTSRNAGAVTLTASTYVPAPSESGISTSSELATGTFTSRRTSA